MVHTNMHVGAKRLLRQYFPVVATFSDTFPQECCCTLFDNVLLILPPSPYSNRYESISYVIPDTQQDHAGCVL